MSFSLPTLLKDDPNVIKWVPEISVYLFQTFQLMRKQIGTPCSQRPHSQALCRAVAGTGSDLLLLPQRFGGRCLSRFLISRNPITHVGCGGLTPADTFIMLALPRSASPLPRSSQPSSLQGSPHSLILLCGSWQETSSDGFHRPLTSL